MIREGAMSPVGSSTKGGGISEAGRPRALAVRSRLSLVA